MTLTTAEVQALVHHSPLCFLLSLPLQQNKTNNKKPQTGSGYWYFPSRREVFFDITSYLNTFLPQFRPLSSRRHFVFTWWSGCGIKWFLSMERVGSIGMDQEAWRYHAISIISKYACVQRGGEVPRQSACFQTKEKTLSLKQCRISPCLRKQKFSFLKKQCKSPIGSNPAPLWQIHSKEGGWETWTIQRGVSF
jgi:hypothetical protein